MGFISDPHIARNMITRGELIELDDSGGMQLATAHGLAGEQFKQVHRAQGFGVSSTPPAGSHGLIMAVGGRRDQAVIMGFEHADHRPTGTGAGETVLYNAHGDAVSIIKKNIRIVSPKITLIGTLEITGDIQQTGSITSTGAHSAAAHT